MVLEMEPEQIERNGGVGNHVGIEIIVPDTDYTFAGRLLWTRKRERFRWLITPRL